MKWNLLCLYLLSLSSHLFAGEPIYYPNKEAISEFAWQSSKLPPGTNTTLFETEGEGVIERIWFTTSRPSPEKIEIVRSLTLRIFWDGSEKPAVEAPLYDFFNQPFGPQAIRNEISTSEGELLTFCVYLPMPFKKGARVEVNNASNSEIGLWHEFCVDKKKLPSEVLYFHTQWNMTEANPTASIPVLREIKGEGRYLGTHVSAVVPIVDKKWNWYTRDVNFQIDNSSPNLVYNSIDDFIGSAWWSSEKDRKPFTFPYYGRHYISQSNTELKVAFYRYFFKDPVRFKKSIAVFLSPGPKKAMPSSWRTLSYLYLDTPERPETSD